MNVPGHSIFEWYNLFVSGHNTSSDPPSLPPTSEKEGGSDELGHLEPLLEPIFDQNTFRNQQKPLKFSRLRRRISSVFPLETPKMHVQKCDFFAAGGGFLPKTPLEITMEVNF